MTETLREWRLRHHWTQRQAAAELDMPLETYKQRERGIRKISGTMRVAMRGLDREHMTPYGEFAGQATGEPR